MQTNRSINYSRYRWLHRAGQRQRAAVGRISREEAGASGVTILSTIIPESRGREATRATSRLRFPLESNDASMARVAAASSLSRSPLPAPSCVFPDTHVHCTDAPTRPLLPPRSPHFAGRRRRFAARLAFLFCSHRCYARLETPGIKRSVLICTKPSRKRSKNLADLSHPSQPRSTNAQGVS